MNREKNDSVSPEIEENSRRKRAAKRQDHMGGDKRDHSRKWLFWTVDVLLILIIVAAILFAVSLLTPFSLFGSDGEEERNIQYTVEFVGVDSDSIAMLKVGDTVTDAKTGSVIGTVVAINNRPYEVYTDTPVYDKTLDSWIVGTYTYPDSYATVMVTIAVTATYEQGVGYTAEDCRIAVGGSYELRFPCYTASGECIAIGE